jgi:hypothetical protein
LSNEERRAGALGASADDGQALAQRGRLDTR